MSGPHQRASGAKPGMIERHRFEEFTDVVDDQGAGQPAEHGLAFGQVASIELQLDVPAERSHPGGHGFEDLPWERCSCQHEEADAAGAKFGEPFGSASVTSSSTTTMHRAFGPIVATASNVHRLSLP